MKRTPFAHIFILIAFLSNSFGLNPIAQAQDFHLPAPGVMVGLSPEFNPPILKGVKVHPDNPFKFDFILDKGDGQLSNDALKNESSKLIKYFLASLTIPEKDLWVNLSPYEKDRIIPNSFGLTEMGRDLLAEDYMLKQITASLIYPEGETGKRFWKRIYEEAVKKFGTTNIPVNTFNKVWIVPEKAVVYENAKAGTAYVVESKLKVMLEQDYLSLQKHEGIQSAQTQAEDANQLGSQIVREIVLPELTKEVNENKSFSQLRQVYNSLILATWYKKKIKDSILDQVYANRNKVAGVNINDPQEKQRIYERYLRAFKKGVYNYIKEEQDPFTQETIPRKYFSGGEELIDVSKTMSYIKGSAFLKKLVTRGMLIITASLLSFSLATAQQAADQVVKSDTTFVSDQSPILKSDGGLLKYENGSLEIDMGDVSYFVGIDNNGNLKGGINSKGKYVREMNLSELKAFHDKAKKELFTYYTDATEWGYHRLFEMKTNRERIASAVLLKDEFKNNPNQEYDIDYIRDDGYLFGKVSVERAIVFSLEGNAVQIGVRKKDGLIHRYSVSFSDITQVKLASPRKILRVVVDVKDNNVVLLGHTHSDNDLWLKLCDFVENPSERLPSEHPMIFLSQIMFPLRPTVDSYRREMVDIKKSIDTFKNTYGKHINAIGVEVSPIEMKSKMEIWNRKERFSNYLKRIIGSEEVNKRDIEEAGEVDRYINDIFLYLEGSEFYLTHTDRDMKGIKIIPMEDPLVKQEAMDNERRGETLLRETRMGISRKEGMTLDSMVRTDPRTIDTAKVKYMFGSPFRRMLVNKYIQNSLKFWNDIDTRREIGFYNNIIGRKENIIFTVGSGHIPALETMLKKYGKEGVLEINQAMLAPVISKKFDNAKNVGLNREILQYSKKKLLDGGIDFTINKTPLEIQNSGEGIKFHLDKAQLAQLQNAPGFVPVIINIQPMTNLRQFLGIADNQSIHPLA